MLKEISKNGVKQFVSGNPVFHTSVQCCGHYQQL